MIILTNCLTETLDEGNIKVMSKIAKMIRSTHTDAEIITYTNEHEISDYHVSTNKLLLSIALMKYIRMQHGPVLYCPATARVLLMAIRTAIVSLYSRRKTTVVLTMLLSEIDAISRFLLQLSGAKLITLSRDLYEVCSDSLTNDVRYIKAGVDTQKFQPVDQLTKAALRRKYGIDAEKPVVLHVGHMQEGRNIRQLLALDESVQVILVTSTYESQTRDLRLREELARKENITLIEDYVPDIEEIYQLSDVYFFPVLNEANCISVPLSVLEAAACNLPVVCTAFGELKQFRGKDGFYFIDSFEPFKLNELVSQAMRSKANTRACAEEYEWKNAVKAVIRTVEEQEDGVK